MKNGIFEWDQAQALSKAGGDVDYFIVDLRSFRRLRPWGIRHGESNGVRWHSISIPVGAVPRSLLCRIGEMALRKLYRKVFRGCGYVPDVIHAHFIEIGCMALGLAEKEGIPLVLTEHSSAMVQPVISCGLQRLALQGYQGANRVLAVSSFLKERIYQHTGIVAEVVPNILPKEFHYEKRRLHPGMKYIVTANLNEGKRIYILLRAFARLSGRYSDVSLEIVGDGEQREPLERLAKELSISNIVMFHGALPRQKIAILYRECDCFVLPSAFETFGVAYIEAMATGLPVIATRCGGPEDFVNEDNGLLVPIDDIDALTDAMDYMYNNGQAFSRSLISDFVLRNFSGEIVAKKMLHIYEEVVN